MLNFLKSTEINMFLSKEKLIAKLDLSTTLKESLKNDVKRFTITNELSPKSMNIKTGENVSAVFVMEVQLKQKEVDYKLIEAIAKQNAHKLLFVLHYEDEMQLAVFYGKLYRGQWVKQSDLNIEINGDTFDAVWDNIVGQIALTKTDTVTMHSDVLLEEQLAKQEEIAKLKREIERLEKQARIERQPKRKFEIVGKVGELRGELEGLE